MTTPMRWADSDSDDSDDGYNLNEESSEAFEPEEAPLPTYNQQNQAHAPPRDHYKSNYISQNKGDRKNQQSYQTKNYQKGGNSNYGGGKNRQHNSNKNRGGGGDWKKLAKASSRFSSGMY